MSLLLVDDNESMLTLIKAELADDFPLIYTRKSVEEAWSFLREAKKDEIDIVVLDVNMPEDSGPELARRINSELDCVVSIIFLTGNRDFTLKMGFDLGADAVLYKGPDTLEVLRPALKHFSEKLKRLRFLTSEVTEQKIIIAKQSLLSLLGENSAALIHEISNPVTVLAGFIDSGIRGQNLDQGILARMKIQMTRLVEILQQAKLGVHGSLKQGRSQNIDQILVDSFEVIKVRAQKHCVTLEIPDISELKKWKIGSNSTGLYQSFVNICNNAIDAARSSQERKVQIRYRIVGRTLCLYIQDSGPGVPEDIREKIFELLFTTKEKEGTGLGLHVATKLLADLGGRVDLLPGQTPCIFQITIPVFPSGTAE